MESWIVHWSIIFIQILWTQPLSSFSSTLNYTYNYINVATTLCTRSLTSPTQVVQTYLYSQPAQASTLEHHAQSLLHFIVKRNKNKHLVHDVRHHRAHSGFITPSPNCIQHLPKPILLVVAAMQLPHNGLMNSSSKQLQQTAIRNNSAVELNRNHLNPTLQRSHREHQQWLGLRLWFLSLQDLVHSCFNTFSKHNVQG